MRLKNLNENEVNQSIFTSTLQAFMNNVGLTLPFDSDPAFYKDHYERETRLRQKQGSEDNTKLFVTDKLSRINS